MVQSCFAETICYSIPSLNGQRSAVKYPGRSGSSVWKNVQGYFLQQPVVHLLQLDVLPLYAALHAVYMAHYRTYPGGRILQL